MAFDDESASGHDEDEPWIQWFCGLKGHEMFCEVEKSYIEDGFNLYGLRACVSNFSDCLDLILDRIGPDEDSDDSQLTQSACTLYGLIHARYIITAHGLDAMYGKYAAKEFGTCPLVQCGGQPVLPVSLKDEMGADTVKIYCPKCSQVYHPPQHRSRSSSSLAAASGASLSKSGSTTGNAVGRALGGTSNTASTSPAGGVDGAAFGTTFPHLFLMTFSNLVPDPLPLESAYVPRVFGFRVHKSARQRFNPPTTQLQLSNNPTTIATTANEPLRSNLPPDDDDDDDDDNNNTNKNNHNNNSIVNSLTNVNSLNNINASENITGNTNETYLNSTKNSNITGSAADNASLRGPPESALALTSTSISTQREVSTKPAPSTFDTVRGGENVGKTFALNDDADNNMDDDDEDDVPLIRGPTDPLQRSPKRRKRPLNKDRDDDDDFNNDKDDPFEEEKQEQAFISNANGSNYVTTAIRKETPTFLMSNEKRRRRNAGNNNISGSNNNST